MKRTKKNIQFCEENFKCAICLNILDLPTTIPCGHSFCLNCIGKLYDRDERDCPLCKTRHSVAHYNPENCKLNIIINTMIEKIFPDRPKSIRALALEYNRQIRKEEYNTGKKIIELTENIKPFFKYFGHVVRLPVVENKEYEVNKLKLNKYSSEDYPVMTFKHIPMIDIDYKFEDEKVITGRELMEKPIMRKFLSKTPHIIYKSGKNSKHIFLLDWHIDWEKKDELIKQFQQLLDLGCDAKYLLYSAVSQGFNVRLGSKLSVVRVSNTDSESNSERDSDTDSESRHYSPLDSYYEKEIEYLGVKPSKKILHNRDLVLKHETLHEVFRTEFKLKGGENYFPGHVIKKEVKNCLKNFAIN